MHSTFFGINNSNDAGLPNSNTVLPGNGYFRISGLPLDPVPISYTVMISPLDGKNMAGDGSDMSSVNIRFVPYTGENYLKGYNHVFRIQNTGQNDIVFRNYSNRPLKVIWYPQYQTAPVQMIKGPDFAWIESKSYQFIFPLIEDLLSISTT